MTVQDIQSLVDLIGQSSTVTNIAVTAPDGASVSIKRTVAPQPTSMVLYNASAQTDAMEAIIEELTIEAELEGGLISAPLVGIFHAAKPPVAEGTLIKLGQIVGYIESMRLMTELKAEVEGVVTVVLIDDRQPVEYAQPLFRVMPAEE